MLDNPQNTYAYGKFYSVINPNTNPQATRSRDEKKGAARQQRCLVLDSCVRAYLPAGHVDVGFGYLVSV